MIPDVSPIAREFLLAQAPVTALVGTRVYILRLPWNVTWPCLLLTPFAQLSTTPHVDRTVDATVQIEGFGESAEDEEGAWTIVATAQDQLRAGLVSYHHAGGRVSAVIPETGLQFLPDNEHDKARCVASVRLIAYPPST